LDRLKTFSPRHRRYIMAVLDEIVRHYGTDLLGLAVFGSYARGENRLNSDLDLLIILRRAPGLRQRIEEFVDQIEMKCEPLAQEIYAEEDILCELSPYILSREEALKMQPVYYDLAEHHMIVYDPAGLIARIIDGTREALSRAGARREERGGTWEWRTEGFLGGTDL